MAFEVPVKGLARDAGVPERFLIGYALRLAHMQQRPAQPAGERLAEGLGAEGTPVHHGASGAWNPWVMGGHPTGRSLGLDVRLYRMRGCYDLTVPPVGPDGER